MRIKLIAFSVALLVISSVGRASTHDSGSIEGTVMDAQTGEPISGARVEAESEEGSMSKALPSAFTDAKGMFVLKNLPAGTYVIAASKEADFYPDTDAAAFESGIVSLPRVAVHDEELVRGVIIRIAKGGRLIGAVRDAYTQAPIRNAALRLSRLENPKLWISIGPDERGTFEFVIPPDAQFVLEVTAPGYRKWKSTDSRPALQIEAQSTEKIVIQLERE